MAVRRDYGSFSKAAQRDFGRLIAPLGWKSMGGVNFCRAGATFNHALFLQQSQWGGGEFRVIAGIDVPQLAEMFGEAPSPAVGVLVGGDLPILGYELGLSGPTPWLPANNKAELLDSFKTFADYLSLIDPWFSRFNNLGDVADAYVKTTCLLDSPIAEVPWEQQRAAAIYGYLLYLSGRGREAFRWFDLALKLMRQPIYYTHGKHQRIMKPSKESAEIMASVEHTYQRVREEVQRDGSL